jgi:hypothetical protein
MPIKLSDEFGCALDAALFGKIERRMNLAK